MDGDRVDRVFVAVRDITIQVQLENKLREAEKSKERELEILLSIIHVPNGELENFITLAKKELDTVNDSLRAEDFAAAGGKQAALRDQLKTVYSCIHNLNGNAALLRLTYFQKAAHAFETQIKKLLDHPTLSGDDFLAIIVAQASLRTDLANLQDLSNKLKSIGGVMQPPLASKSAPEVAPTSVISEQLRQLVENTAKELGKAANLTIDEYALHAFSHDRKDLVKDALVQLCRNAVVHGVETKADRKKKGKEDVAQLSVHPLPSPSPGVMGLAFRDDGRGLNFELIQKRAQEAGLLPKGETAEHSDIIKCIFEPTFSTTEEADLHSGRGVGMAIVKSKIVDEGGGCIEVVTEADKFCEFRLYLPI
jgi:two-component system, chemotaxis family, sensor kinase CheA